MFGLWSLLFTSIVTTLVLCLGTKHLPPASLVKHVLILVLVCTCTSLHPCLNHVWIKVLFLRTRIGPPSLCFERVRAHTSVFSLVQTCLTLVACLFTLPPAPKRSDTKLERFYRLTRYSCAVFCILADIGRATCLMGQTETPLQEEWSVSSFSR